MSDNSVTVGVPGSVISSLNSGSTVAGGSSNSGSGTNAAIAGLDGADFMTLLITQLKNQDPMNPQDPTQMLSQLSELTSVQKLTSIDSNLAKMVDANSIPTSSYLGAYVGLSSSTASVRSGDAGMIRLNLPEDASAISLKFLSADGQSVVKSVDLGEASKGAQYAYLNSLDLPDGDYQLRIDATNASGKVFNPTFTVGGIVTAIHTGAENTLTVNDQEISTSQVVEIAVPPSVGA